ncbi:MAG TPA: hypothetical protein VGP57_19105 [Actinoplanes sp.]|nr:hypothetical protein [Actinoplanes sp.]
MDTTQLLKGVLDLAVLAVLRDEDGYEDGYGYGYGYELLRRLRAAGRAQLGRSATVWRELPSFEGSAIVLAAVVASVRLGRRTDTLPAPVGRSSPSSGCSPGSLCSPTSTRSTGQGSRAATGCRNTAMSAAFPGRWATASVAPSASITPSPSAAPSPTG